MNQKDVLLALTISFINLQLWKTWNKENKRQNCKISRKRRCFCQRSVPFDRKLNCKKMLRNSSFILGNYSDQETSLYFDDIFPLISKRRNTMKRTNDGNGRFK